MQIQIVIPQPRGRITILPIFIMTGHSNLVFGFGYVRIEKKELYWLNHDEHMNNFKKIFSNNRYRDLLERYFVKDNILIIRDCNLIQIQISNLQEFKRELIPQSLTLDVENNKNIFSRTPLATVIYKLTDQLKNKIQQEMITKIETSPRITNSSSLSTTTTEAFVSLALPCSACGIDVNDLLSKIQQLENKVQSLENINQELAQALQREIENNCLIFQSYMQLQALVNNYEQSIGSSNSVNSALFNNNQSPSPSVPLIMDANAPSIYAFNGAATIWSNSGVGCDLSTNPHPSIHNQPPNL